MTETQGKDILEQGLTAMSIALDAQARDRLAVYCDELIRWGAKINLVAKAPLREIWETHFLDSLSLLRVLPPQGSQQQPLLDIGTGAGFPGLALKAARPELPVILVDPRQKRVSFLRHVIRTLGLKDIEVLCGRLEKTSAEVDGHILSIPIITSRAFTDIGEFLLHTEAVSPAGGRVICMKGPRAGEIHANFQEGSTSGKSNDKLDFHRMVALVGYEFTDWIKFQSEIELEHAYVQDTNL